MTIVNSQDLLERARREAERNIEAGAWPKLRKTPEPLGPLGEVNDDGTSGSQADATSEGQAFSGNADA